jgi:ubiquinone/menaquinone biosynthesis C-methylase UbiE
MSEKSIAQQPRRRRSNSSEAMLQWRYGLIEPFIDEGSQVLDLGSGTGWVGKRIQERKGCMVRLVDVLDCNETDLPLTLYDGKSIPHPDRSFDITLLMFVLHHTTNDLQILREAARVSRRRIVVVEDTPRNPLERFVDRTCDTLMSLQHGYFNPANYKTTAEWERIFATLGLRVGARVIEKPFIPFYYTKTVFALDVA